MLGYSLDDAFRRPAQMAHRFAEIVARAETPTDPTLAKRLGELQRQSVAMAANVQKGNYFNTVLKTVFLLGLACGLGVITDEETDSVWKTMKET